VARLPRYRPLGAQIPSLPTVDYAGTARAQARVAQTIGQQLDRMASVAFREAEIQAKIEGAEYGATNAPSIEQLQQAATPAGREELVPGGTGTVYDRAAREAALRVIANDLDTSAREEIANLRLTAASQNMPVADLQNKIDGVINGYAAAVYDISPAASSNFRAGIAAAGNSAAVAHANNMAEQAAEKRERDAIRGIDVLLNEIPDIVSRGDYIGATGVTVTVQQKLDFQKEKLFSKAEDLDPNVLSSKLKDFNSAVSKAITGAVVSYGIESPRARMKEFRTGNIGDPQIARLWNGLDDTQKDAIHKQIRDEIKDQNALIASEERIAELKEKEREEELIPIIYGGLRSGADVSTELAEMSLLNPTLHEQMISIRDTQGGIDDADTMSSFNVMAANGSLATEDVLEAIADRRLTSNTGDKYFSKIKNRKDERYRRASSMLSRAYGNPERIMTNRQLKGDEIVRMEKLNQHLDDIDMLMDADPNFDALEYANKIVEREAQARSTSRARDDLETDINTRLELFPSVKAITNIDIKIEEAERLLSVPYEPGGLFTSQTGLNDQRRLQLMDVLKDLRKLQTMGAGQ